MVSPTGPLTDYTRLWVNTTQGEERCGPLGAVRKALHDATDCTGGRSPAFRQPDGVIYPEGKAAL